MMDKSYKAVDYPVCNLIKRTDPDVHVDKDILEKFLQESDVLPLVESKKYDYIRIRYCSLVTNELLRCRWAEFQQRAAGRKKTPFMFPNVDDDHFYLYQSRYAPAQSLSELVRGAKGRRA